MGGLKSGDEVVYTVFADMSGFIIGRADGEWTGVVPGGVLLTGKGIMKDLATGAVASFNGHIHQCPEGGDTGGPK